MFKILAPALAAAALALTIAPAAAGTPYGNCPTATSLFGTVVQVGTNNRVLLKTTGAVNHEWITTDGAHMYANGLALRPGVFVGDYGCFTDNRQLFRSSDITLATSAAAYPRVPAVRHDESIKGVVRRNYGSYVLIQTGFPHGFVKVYGAKTPAGAGTTIRATGFFLPNGSFQASQIDNNPSS